jgi:hypothetical protein
MNDEGDLVSWTGELRQPLVPFYYRSFFSAVDVHNKLALGPRSVCGAGANHLLGVSARHDRPSAKLFDIPRKPHAPSFSNVQPA